MPSRNFSLRLSAFNAFLFLGTGIQTPFLPLWLSERGFGADRIALVLAVMTLARVFAIPIGAYIADRHGNRRAVILTAAFGALACYVLMGVVQGYWAVLVMALLAAAFFSPVSPLAEVLSIEGASTHGVDYGRIRLWASISFLSGSLLSGALLEVVPVASVIFLIAAAQGLGAVVALLLPSDPAPASRPHERLKVGAIARCLAAPSFLLFMAAAGIGQATHGFFYAFGSVNWDHLGYGKLTIGELWATGILVEIVMFGFSNRIFKQFGSTRLIAIGVGCGLVRWLLIGLDPPLWLLFFAQTLHAGSFGLTHLGTMHFIRENVPNGMRNTAQGVYAALTGGILLSMSQWVAGPLYGEFGGGGYFVMAAFSALALGLALVLIRISPRDPAAAGS